MAKSVFHNHFTVKIKNINVSQKDCNFNTNNYEFAIRKIATFFLIMDNYYRAVTKKNISSIDMNLV